MVKNSTMIRLSALVLSLALGAFGCASTGDTTTDRTGQTGQTGTQTAQQMQSGEILQVMQAINEGEISQAELAMRRSSNPEVQQTAELIIQDHRSMQQRIQQVADSTGADMSESPLSRRISEQATRIEDELAELSGDEFDREFLRRQVDMHELALQTAQQELMPNAEDPQVRQLLTNATSSLEHHLTMARQSYQEYEDSAIGGGPKDDQSQDDKTQDDQMQDDGFQEGQDDW